MTALYFATSKEGYVRKPFEGGMNIDCSKQIPVYKRVNEFMFGEPKEADKSVIKEVDEEADHYEYQKSAKSLDHCLENSVKYVMIKSAHLLEKPENDSFNEDEMGASVLKQREYSLRDTSASQIETAKRPNIKINIVSSQIGKNEDHEQILDRSELEKEIQKEKTLRLNLEHSYYSLLQKLKQEQKDLSINCSIQYGKVMTNKKISLLNEEQEQTPETTRGYLQPIRSKTESSFKIKNEDRAESLYSQHLKRERYFQSCLLDQIEEANAKIEQLQKTIVRREIFQQKKLQQAKSATHLPSPSKIDVNQLLAESSKIKSQANTDSPTTQLHYIFTIFVMFLIAAMALKSK